MTKIACFTTDNHNNDCHDETLILSSIDGDTISHSLSKKNRTLPYGTVDK